MTSNWAGKIRACQSAEDVSAVLAIKVGTREAYYVERVFCALRPLYPLVPKAQRQPMFMLTGRGPGLPIGKAEWAAQREAWREQAEANRQARRAAVLAAWQAKACATHRGAVGDRERAVLACLTSEWTTSARLMEALATSPARAVPHRRFPSASDHHQSSTPARCRPHRGGCGSTTVLRICETLPA